MQNNSHPSLILVAAKVVTLDEDRPIARALAIQGDRIMAVGTAAEILARRGPGTRVLHLAGVVYPGLTDAHAHLASLGAALEQVDLRGAADPAAAAARVGRRAAERPQGEWIRGRGWDQTRWPGREMPDHRAFTAAAPDHPVWLKRVDGHAGLANARALAAAGIDKETTDPLGGRIERFPDGSPTGLLIDNAMDLVEKVIPPPTNPALERRLLRAQEACFAAGLTRIHDAWTTARVQELLRDLESAGKWRLGVYGMHPAPTEGAELPPADDPGPRATLRFRAVKLFADGALGSRGAALLEPYTDDPDNRGLLVTPERQLRLVTAAAAAQGLQPCTHAIGDRANRLMLKIYETELTAVQRIHLRPRIEHAQVLHAEDLERFARLEILASMQPTHLTTDMPWAPRRLGPERIPGSYAFRTLMESGVRVSFGSDFPVEPHSPLRGLYAAITTADPDHPGGKALRPDQRLTPEQALRGFTTEAAFAAFEEQVRGRVKEGFQADLTVLGVDLLADSPERILKAEVEMVVAAGRVVYP